MFVKSLTLKGFKSFAESTTLDLQPGVNVVVGPNGSGKSNVIDAVAWVLGAQGARALRGGKMDDVIFAGTTKRQALGRAEVSLQLDNHDGRVPVEFSEITITRTLFRTGESEYAMNGVPCRLLDIQELLSDSGVGRQQHVIVSQGNLDAVLSARPEDRRMIIEEAAGVLKFRKRREKAQRRLEATEGNLERLQDLVREVRQQMRPLQRQANAAMRHEAVTSELHALKLFVTSTELGTLRHRMQNAKGQVSEGAVRLREIAESLTHLSGTQSRLEAAQMDDSIDQLNTAVDRLRRSEEAAHRYLSILSERKNTYHSELSVQVSKDVVAQLESDAATVDREIELVRAERLDAQTPFEDLEAREAQHAAEWVAFEEEWGDGLPLRTNEAAELRGASTSLQKSTDSLGQAMTRRQEKVEALEAEHLEAQASLAELVAQTEDLHAELTLLDEDHTEATRRQHDAEEAYGVQERAVQDLDRKVAVARAKRDALVSALDDNRAKAGMQKLSGIKGVLGTLSDLVEVDETYQAAFEAAVERSLSAVVVDSTKSAAKSLAQLSAENDAGAVLCVEPAVGETHGAPEGTALRALRPLVSSTRKDVESLLDRLLCCCVVADGSWEEAVPLAKAYPNLVIVTRAGDRFCRGAWRLGSEGVGTTMAAARAAELDVLELESLRTQASHASEVLRQNLENAHENYETIEGSLRRSLKRRDELEREVERLERRMVTLAEEQETQAKHLSDLRHQYEEESGKLQVIQLKLPELEAEEASSDEHARRWREARGVLETKSTELGEERRNLEIHRDGLEQRETYLLDRHAALQAKLERYSRELSQAAERREELWRKITGVERLSTYTAALQSRCAEELSRVVARRDEVRRTLAEQRDRLRVVRERRDALDVEQRALQEGRQQAELRLAELRVRQEALQVVLTEELGVDEETAAQVPEPVLADGVTPKRRIAELERDLRQMGPINPLAVEEYTQIEERHTFLDQQLHDVQSSRRELTRVIRSVDAEIVSVFHSAYEDVSRHFAELFGTLFPGGTGRLRLTDPEALLETGIEIEAKPSGKNVRTLTLLSGGERSLVALAFLFAVFRSRPSPFYLLDEVEAALDDVNLSRFLLLLEAFRQDAQLVVVSHQKRTMEKADCLFGVSMQPGGSSKVISGRVEVDVREATGEVTVVRDEIDATLGENR